MSQTNTEVGAVQDAAMTIEPQEQHHWLQKLVGEWGYETQVSAKPGEAPGKITGTERVRSLGGLWIVAEGEGQIPGAGLATTLMTLGYDPKTGRFVGTWVGSMMPNMWVYDGELDPAGKVLALNSEGPSMKDDGTTARYQDVIELKSDDHRVFTARVQNADGQWESFMTMDYRRR